MGVFHISVEWKKTILAKTHSLLGDRKTRRRVGLKPSHSTPPGHRSARGAGCVAVLTDGTRRLCGDAGARPSQSLGKRTRAPAAAQQVRAARGVASRGSQAGRGPLGGASRCARLPVRPSAPGQCQPPLYPHCHSVCLH